MSENQVFGQAEGGMTTSLLTVVNYLMITILAFIVFMKREEQLN